MKLRAVERNGRWLVNLLNLTRDARQVVVKTDRPIGRAVNLFDNSDVTMPPTVESLDPVLLAVEVER